MIGNLIISLMSLFMGLAIGSVGADPLYGVNRLTFGIGMLESGVDFVVVMIGLYAIAEVIGTIAARTGIRGLDGEDRPLA